MLQAIRMINEARQAANKTTPVVVDLQPDRPDFRGFQAPTCIVSLEADPSFEEAEQAGAVLTKNGSDHAVLDNMFLICGEIPRTTEYEVGVQRGLRFRKGENKWIADTLIRDERYLMCNLKGKPCQSKLLGY